MMRGQWTSHLGLDHHTQDCWIPDILVATISAHISRAIQNDSYTPHTPRESEFIPSKMYQLHLH